MRFAIEGVGGDKAPSDSMSSPILVLCYKQVRGNLNENLTADQMSLGACLHPVQTLPVKDDYLIMTTVSSEIPIMIIITVIART